MAINAQKLLPPGKLTTGERMAASYDKRIDDLLNFQIKTKIINVEKLFKKNTVEKKKRVVVKKRKQETEKREKKEKRLEKQKETEKFKLKVPGLPKTGFLDSIQNFISFTFLGYLINNYYQYLPQLLNFAKIIGPAMKFLETFVVGTFESAVFLIDSGYKANEQIRGAIKSIGGENAQKEFDKFTTNFQNLVNRVLTFGLYQPSTPQQTNGGLVKKMEVGGNVPKTKTPANKPISRKISVVKQKSKPKVRPQQSQPGKDIGGKKRIEKLFPNPTGGTKTVNPLRSLTNTSKTLKQVPFVGGIMGAAVDLAMGQKPNESVYRSFGSSIGSLIQNAIDNQTNLTINDITKTVFAMAGGGPVTRGITTKKTTGEEIGMQIARMFEISMTTKVDMIFNQLMREMGFRGVEGQEPTPSGIPLEEGQIASGKKLMQGLIQRGFTKEEAAAIVGNLWAESGFRTGATNPDSGAFGLMQWLGGRKSRLYSYASEKGKSVTDVELQLDYIKWELKGGNDYETRQFKKAMAYGSDVASKTKGFAEQVERASSSELSGSMAKRIGAAESVFGGKMVAGETPSIGLGRGYSAEGSRIAGELGRYLNKNLVPGKDFLRVTEHPEFGGVVNSVHAPDSYHKYGRAIDIGAYSWEQPKILAAIAKFNRERGVKPVQILHARNASGHDDHVHVAYAKGGLVSRPTRAIIGEKGPEFIFDADTTRSLEGTAPGLLHRLNMAKTKKEVNSILQSYASYEDGSKDVVLVLSEKIIMSDKNNSIDFPSVPQSLQTPGLNSRVPTLVG